MKRRTQTRPGVRRRGKPSASRMAGTRVSAPAEEPSRVGRQVAAVGGVLLLLAAVAAAPHAYRLAQDALHQEPFLLAELTVAGLDRLEPAAIRSALALEPGTPLVELDVDAARARLVAHPWVAEASVVRWPPDGVRVEVREQVALAVARAGEARRFHAVNASGVAFAEASEADVARLVHVALEPAPEVGVADGRLTEALAMAASFQTRGLEVPRQVRVGLPAREQSAELRLRGFAPAVWIERGRHEEQLDRLATLLASSLPAANEARLIDLRFSGRAVLWAGDEENAKETASAESDRADRGA